jgi:hypothetical protein
MTISKQTEKFLDNMKKREKKGERLVALSGKAVGDKYSFELEDYKVIEICKSPLIGYCWIRKVRK